MPTSIRRLATTAAADQVITKEEAQQLVARATADGKVTSYERAQLRAALAQHHDLFTADARRAVDEVLSPRPPPPGQTVALDPTPSQRPVFLSADGGFTVNASGAAPRTPVEQGEALFRAGELVDNARDNVFAALPEATRAKAFAQLERHLAVTPPPAGLEARQALQARASAGAVLLHLLEGTKEPQLQATMLAAYERLVRAEPDKRLQENLVFHLSNSSAARSGPAKQVAASLMEALAPLSPPYAKWFANGNSTVKLDWQIGDEFVDGFRRMLTTAGWRETQPGSGVYQKAFTEPGVGETKFELRTRLAGGSNLLEKLGDPGVHIMGYDGHASWGKNQVRSIKSAPRPASGGDGQLFFSNLCVGKSQLDAFKETFPNLQVATTYGSSAVDTDIDGLARLIAKRAKWTDINPFLDRVDGERGRDNFITPASTLVREQVLDRDNDGQADYLDKHFNVSTFNVATDTAREFRPVKQDRPAALLDGTKIHIAAQVLNTVSEFSGILKQVNEHSRVLPGGWFEPDAGDVEVVRFEKVKGRDGQPEYRMRVNARYAHMSEEALRATCVFEFNRFLQASGEQRLDPVDRKLAAVISFAQSLDIDDSFRDDEVFTNFLARYNLPPIPRGDIQALLDAEHHDYAGNQAMVNALKAKLAPGVLATLKKPEVGEPVRYV
ncbi:MAG: hypothetical protein INH41_18305 [Myxococcaceae bacterium]|jgi:hypothetical protein|nr:hypothetical protein [Myxococcaceae bacterium]MCA3014340.1 hypothetical protein [Myxococcaceae bacterium]